MNTLIILTFVMLLAYKGYKNFMAARMQNVERRENA